MREKDSPGLWRHVEGEFTRPRIQRQQILVVVVVHFGMRPNKDENNNNKRMQNLNITRMQGSLGDPRATMAGGVGWLHFGCSLIRIFHVLTTVEAEKQMIHQLPIQFDSFNFLLFLNNKGPRYCHTDATDNKHSARL